MSKTTLPEAPAARDVLGQAEAAERAARVREARYEIRLDLRAGDTTYRGEARLDFATTGSGPLFLDFRGRRIEQLTVNGQDLDPDWTGYRLVLPASVVTADMAVTIRYENDFDDTGDGFHRFVDPEDGEEYAYTNFEPFEAHRLFPCFDQPDIKGRYLFEVTAPAAWEVIGNSPLSAVEDIGGGRRRHRFVQSELFSTYLAALACGPYVKRTLDHHGLALGLYARRSMMRELEEHAAEIFEVTTQGLDFYSELFDQPYPFAKYDQLFVPEYNSGAMENVGAVTYNEAYLFRDPPTDNDRLDRAEVLLHELAHMWFGNLVTMRWWNDLWLNESFATYIAYLGLTEATRFDNAWKVFNTDMKRWAYQQDQLVTTHPIAGEAADTEEAFLNFDGITYGKGAAVLKQLVNAIGRDAFAEGMRLYFRRHAWGNATLRDFLGCLEQASGRPLTEWARLWLETASLNTIAAEWRTEQDRLAALALRQTAPPEHPTLRPHALDVALGREEGERLLIDALPASIERAEATVETAGDRPAPCFVFPNHGDHGYAKIALDPVSLDYVRQHLERIDDVLLRQLLWMSLWEMVRDCQLSSSDFVATCLTRLASESDLDVVNSGLERMALAIARYIPESRREATAHEAFETALANLESSSNGDAQIMWARSAIANAATAQDVRRLLDLLDGQPPLGGFSFDQDMRWGIVTKAVAHGLPNAEQRLTVETTRDPSDRGRRALIKAEASRPDRSAKEQAWQKIHGVGYGSFHFTRAAMQGFFWPHQADLLEPFVARFFEHVRDVFTTRDHPFSRAYLIALYPAYRADPEVLAHSRRLLDSLNGAMPTLSRQLAEAADELERAIRVRAYAES
ncbi:MAG TPA: aminopeptidase N [Candidatus Caenarcaniphilales bacterium]|nr:aminopeptidase N [Candidatus Caenarcaniphilales bacterium]